jgi:hypothetical protein
MNDRQVEFAIFSPSSLDPRALHNDEAAIDLLPPVHPRRILLADEATLGEADAIQFGCVAFEPEKIAKLGASFADPKAEAMLEPA